MSTVAVNLNRGISKIEVDGVPVTAVRTFRVTSEAGKLPVVDLECFFETIDLKGGAEVRRVTLCPGCEGRIAKSGGFVTSPLAQAAYEAYTDNRPLQGDGTVIQSLPSWDDLPEDEQLPWEHVARAIKLHGR